MSAGAGFVSKVLLLKYLILVMYIVLEGRESTGVLMCKFFVVKGFISWI